MHRLFESACLVVASSLVVIAGQTTSQVVPPAARILDATRPITYFIAEGTGKIGFRATDRQLAQRALNAWQRSSANRVRFEAATEVNALVRL